MKKIGSRGQKWLKGIHVLFAGLWVCAGICLSAVNLFINVNDGMSLYGVNITVKFIDDFILIPGAVGLTLTGIIYSTFTNWGWFKHRWITVKWCICAFGMIIGTFWLGGWVNLLPVLTKAEGLNVLTNPEYLHAKYMILSWGSFQAATIIAALFISTLKPWKKKKGTAAK
jgi:hypothetical protein